MLWCTPSCVIYRRLSTCWHGTPLCQDVRLYHESALYLPAASFSIPPEPQCEGSPGTWSGWPRWTRSPGATGVPRSCHRHLALGQLEIKREGREGISRDQLKALCYCNSRWGGPYGRDESIRVSFKHRNSNYVWGLINMRVCELKWLSSFAPLVPD